MYSHLKAEKESISFLNQKPYFPFHTHLKRNKEGRRYVFDPSHERSEVFSGFKCSSLQKQSSLEQNNVAEAFKRFFEEHSEKTVTKDSSGCL